MRTLAANLAFSTDTFNTAFTDINLLLWSLANEVITANSTQGTTTGNASLTGTFTASNVAVTGSLRGGTLSSPASLNVSSNVIFLGVINASANVVINATTTAIGNVSLSGNSTILGLSIATNSTATNVYVGGSTLMINAVASLLQNTSITGTTTFVGNSSISGNSSVVVLNVTGNSTVSEATLGGTNLRINSNVVANGTMTFNNTFTFAGPAVFTNTITANGTSAFNNTVTVIGNTSVSGNSSVVALNVTGNSTITNVYIGGSSLLINTTATFNQNVTVWGSLIQLGNSSANAFTISATGNVGIKNTAPVSTLHINGNYTTSQTNLGTINSTSNSAISLAGGNYFRGTIAGATTISFTNFPANSVTGFICAFSNIGSNLTWPAAVKWANGVAPTFSSNTDVLTFITHDSGTTIYGVLSIKDVR